MKVINGNGELLVANRAQTNSIRYYVDGKFYQYVWYRDPTTGAIGGTWEECDPPSEGTLFAEGNRYIWIPYIEPTTGAVAGEWAQLT